MIILPPFSTAYDVIDGSERVAPDQIRCEARPDHATHDPCQGMEDRMGCEGMYYCTVLCGTYSTDKLQSTQILVSPSRSTQPPLRYTIPTSSPFRAS